MAYLIDHWHGRHGLARSFWVNFLLPSLVVALIEARMRPLLADQATAAVLLACLYVLVGHVGLLVWQTVGLWRSAWCHLRDKGDVLIVTFAQSAIPVALIVAVVSTTTTLQLAFGTAPDGLTGLRMSDRTYRLEVVAEDQAIRIEGEFGIGVSRDLRALLVAEPDTRAIILNSDGGRIFEARGVARQILEHGLETYVFDRCRSACTLAFIAGRTRGIGERATLGFHSYQMNAAVSFIDPREEQEKDRAFFIEQGVDPAFMERVFATAHDDMWHPDGETLLRARVAHSILPDD